MGNDLSKEHLSTWDEPEVKAWKERAKGLQKSFYLGYQDGQWDEYSTDDYELLLIKICFALYGQPQEAESDQMRLQDAYSEKQKEEAKKIKDKILDVNQNSKSKTLKVFIIFVCCKMEEKEFYLPVFRVHTGRENNGDLSKWIDTNCRVYNTWNDWEENNALPMMKYCYPKCGFYTCSDDSCYEFDPEKSPCLKFGTSPACDFTSRMGRVLDFGSGITALASGAIAIGSILTPVGPAVLLGSAIAGGSAAVYGTGRSAARLLDKSKHEESLADFESAMCWLSIALTPAHFATAWTNGLIADGARSGRIFSSTTRTWVTVLNCTVLGLDSGMFVLGIVNLVDKYQKDQMTSLDVLQFSMSVFFFTNTLIQPRTASGIISQVQNEHISQYQNQMTDAEAKQAFQNFVERNQGDGGIRQKSNIVRTINRIENPEGFFKGVGDRPVDIGGRKGRTVIVNESDGQSSQNHIRPQVEKAFKDIKVNGEKIFENLTDDDIKWLDKSLKFKKSSEAVTARRTMILKVTEKLANELGVSRKDEFISLTEMVKSEIKGKTSLDALSTLENLGGPEFKTYVEGIKTDLSQAKKLATNVKFTFSNDFKSVYHYRKHGAEFIAKYPNKINIYLKKIPNNIFQDANLTEIWADAKNGIRKSTYITPHGEYGVLVDIGGERKIATVFNNPQKWEDFNRRLSQTTGQSFVSVSNVGEVAQRLAQSFGLARILINIKMSDTVYDLSEYLSTDDIDPDYLREISSLLRAMALEENDEPEEDQ